MGERGGAVANRRGLTESGRNEGKEKGCIRAIVCCQKTTEKKGTRGGVKSCLGLLENGRNGGSEGAAAICRNLLRGLGLRVEVLPKAADIRREMT